MCFSKKQSKKLTWTHPDFDHLPKWIFGRVGRRKIKKWFFKYIDWGTKLKNVYITMVWRRGLDGSNPPNLCYVLRSGHGLRFSGFQKFNNFLIFGQDNNIGGKSQNFPKLHFCDPFWEWMARMRASRRGVLIAVFGKISYQTKQSNFVPQANLMKNLHNFHTYHITISYMGPLTPIRHAGNMVYIYIYIYIYNKAR